jgi:4-hydroxy-3-polyprenylbenzoate decarboxylase
MDQRDLFHFRRFGYTGKKMKRIVVAFSGASGMIYGERLVQWLVGNGHAVDLLVSKTGTKVFELEIGPAPKNQAGWRQFFNDKNGLLNLHDPDDFTSQLASGSSQRDAMAIIPCSMGMAGRVAAGVSSNLIERAADVMLKEKQPLVIVFRESPLNLIHLENLARLSRAGAIIMPAAPGFYSKPQNIEELVDGFVGRVLKKLGIENNLEKEWS